MLYSQHCWYGPELWFPDDVALKGKLGSIRSMAGTDLFMFLNCMCIHTVCINLLLSAWINENFGFFFLLTGCDEYLNTHPILSFQTNQPVDLIKASSVSLSATQATSCTFNQTYSVYDYSGFQNRWTTISNGFFNLTMTSGNGKFNLSVRTADCQWFTVIPGLSKVASCMAKIVPTNPYETGSAVQRHKIASK